MNITQYLYNNTMDDDNINIPREIITEIFIFSDTYTQASMKSCCKWTYSLKYTSTFTVYSVTASGINIAYRETDTAPILRYHCVNDIQIWMWMIPVPNDLYKWYTCDQLVIKNRTTGQRYSDIICDMLRHRKWVDRAGQDIISWRHFGNNYSHSVKHYHIDKQSYWFVNQQESGRLTQFDDMIFTLEFDNTTGACKRSDLLFFIICTNINVIIQSIKMEDSIFPLEIMLIIAEYTTLESRARLSLTCKDLSGLDISKWIVTRSRSIDNTTEYIQFYNSRIMYWFATQTQKVGIYHFGRDIQVVFYSTTSKKTVISNPLQRSYTRRWRNGRTNEDCSIGYSYYNTTMSINVYLRIGDKDNPYRVDIRHMIPLPQYRRAKIE